MDIEMENLDDKIYYDTAKTQVKKLKSFYIHLFIFIAVNCMILYGNYKYLNPGETIFQLRNFSTAFWWGIGLFAHGLNVFCFDFFLGKDWEERKIREIMERDYKSNDFV